MAVYKTATFVITASVILLNGLEINSLRCYQCVNCNSTNSKIVTCAIPNNTITTTPSTSSTNSPSSSTSTYVGSTTSPISTQSTTTTSPVSTASSTSTSSTASTTSSTSTSSTASTTAESNPNPGRDEPNVIRLVRSVELENSIEDFKDKDCVCDDEICSCTERMTRQTNITFVCATDTYTDNGVKIVNKRCAVDLHNNTNTCLLSGFTSNCKTCSKDLCNFGTSLTASTMLLLTAIMSVFKSF